MRRTVLLLGFLALPGWAAPQLKPPKPAPDPDEARIEALRQKYQELLRTPAPAEQAPLARDRALVRHLAVIVEQAKATGLGNEAAEAEATLRRVLGEDPVRRDLYDIYVHDRARKKAAGRK